MRIIISILTCIPFFLTAQQTFNIRTDLGQLNAVMTSVYPTDSIYYVTGILTEPNNNNYTSSFFARYNLDGSLDSLSILTSNNSGIYETWTPTLTSTNDSSFVLAGIGVDGIGRHILLLKYNIMGDTLWTKRFRNPIINTDFINLDDMIQTFDEGYLLGGTYINSSGQHHEIIIIKTDSLGNHSWQQSYGNNIWDDAATILNQTLDSNYIISWNSVNDNLPASKIYSINKSNWITPQGSTLHTFSTDTNNASVVVSRSLLKTNSGNFYIGGSLGTQSLTSTDVYSNAYLYKLDSNRNWQWGRIIANHPPTFISDVRNLYELDDGNIAAIGTRILADSNFYMGYIQKISPNGDSLWQRTFAALTTNGARNEIYDARPTSDGGYIICGESRSYLPTTEPMQQGWLLKVDSMGCLVPGCHITAVEKLEGQELLQIKTYPNPATDYLNVYVPAIPSSADLQLHLYNLEGKLLQNHPLPQSDATYMMQVDDLVAGTYVLQLLDGDGRLLAVEKIVIQN